MQSRSTSSGGEKQLELEHLVYRALGTPDTSPAVLGAETEEMIAAIRAAMTPYFRNGPIMEKHLTQGFIYRRRLVHNPQEPKVVILSNEKLNRKLLQEAAYDLTNNLSYNEQCAGGYDPHDKLALASTNDRACL